MADDHEAKLLALSLAYINGRRDFIHAMLMAHADGMSYQEMARITGLSEITLRGMIRPDG
jgi:DNA-directed RNA polymerase specialized sigma24 family protein